MTGVSLFDARPFFEKALAFGMEHGILDQARLDVICTDAPKGMVQIARYFGNEFLRPDLEKAKDRIVNLVSLYLEHTSSGDLRVAAESLRDHSFLSRSKGGSDMLKAMIAMPQNSHFGMNERSGFRDEHIPVLAKWSLKSLPDYQAELAKRNKVAQVIDAAIWLANSLGMDEAGLEEAGKDAEAVIRSSLLVLATKRTEMPDWVGFQKIIAALGQLIEKSKASDASRIKVFPIPKDLPTPLADVVETVRMSIIKDLPKMLDPAIPARRLFDHTPAFMGRYFWIEDALSEVDHHDRACSDQWQKTTGGHSDDGSLLTLFLCIAASVSPKTLLTEKTAASLIRKIRKHGLKPPLVDQYISDNAPEHHQQDYADMWQEFILGAQPVLQSDRDYALNDALALLRRECNVGT